MSITTIRKLIWPASLVGLLLVVTVVLYITLSHRGAGQRAPDEVLASLVLTPWDLTGSAAGVPDGQQDFGIDCDVPSGVKTRLADMEVLLHSGNVNGKWATHSRGMNWDKLVFVPGYVEDNLRSPHPQIITRLPEILKTSDKFTILFKLPERDWG